MEDFECQGKFQLFYVDNNIFIEEKYNISCKQLSIIGKLNFRKRNKVVSIGLEMK
jgi:hypothetical protein